MTVGRLAKLVVENYFLENKSIYLCRGIGFITIYNENDVITGKQSFDPVAWISKGGGLSERDPVIARLYPGECCK